MEVNAKSRAYAEELVENGRYLIWSEVDYEGAMKSFNRAIKFNPYSSDAHRGLGDCLVSFDQYKDALKHYSLAIEYDPDNYRAYISRGEIYSGYGVDNNRYRQANVKNLSKAIEDFDEVIEFEPERYINYYVRGQCYEGLGKMDKAKADFATSDRLEAIEKLKGNSSW